MATRYAIALFIMGTLHQALAGRQVLQTFQSLPAVAGTATWAPAPSYSSSLIMTPLQSGTTSNPFGTTTNVFAASRIGSSSSSIGDSGMRKAAPDSIEAVPTIFDTTKRYIGGEGPAIQGLGIVTAVGAGNAPGAKYATQQLSNGHSSIALPMGQQLPAFPNTPIKPPTLIMNDQYQGQAPHFSVLAPAPLNSGAATQLPQAPEWPRQQPQLSLPSMPQLGSLSRLPQPQLPPSLLDFPGQMQRLAQAASEGNLVKAIEDAGVFVRNSISNVTAAADSIITATNDVIASLPKNFTIPGELGKLINSSVDITANVLKSLPKPNSMGPASQVPSMARLGSTQQAGNMLSQLSLPRLPGLDNLQLPRFPGMNVGAAGQSYGIPVSIASTASPGQQYGGDATEFWANEQPAWVTKAMGGTAASPTGSTIGSAVAGNSRQQHSPTAAGAAADGADANSVTQQQGKNVVTATPRTRAQAKRAGADLLASSTGSTPVASNNVRVIPATTVPLPGSGVSISDAAAAAAAAAAAPIVAEPRARLSTAKKASPNMEATPSAPTGTPVHAAAAAVAAPAAAAERVEPAPAATAAASNTPAAADAAATPAVTDKSNSSKTAAAAAAAAVPASAPAVALSSAQPAVAAPVAAVHTPASSHSSSSSTDAVEARSTANTPAVEARASTTASAAASINGSSSSDAKSAAEPATEPGHAGTK